jgi:hypothetical protein
MIYDNTRYETYKAYFSKIDEKKCIGYEMSVTFLSTVFETFFISIIMVSKLNATYIQQYL